MSEAEAHTHAEHVVGLLGVHWMRGLAASLVDRWWLFLLRGLLAILFGVLTLLQPVAALAVLVLLFGVWAFIDGVSALALAIGRTHSWQLFIVGLIGIAVGAFTFYRPDLTAIGLYAAFAGWSIARGLLEIAVAIELRREIEGEAWLVVGGIASIAFGVLLIMLPAIGVLTVAWLIGAYALVFGVLMLGLSLRLRRVREPVARPARRHVVPTDLGAGTPQPV